MDAAAREELLTTLFDLWKFGDNYGGIGEDVAEAMAEHTAAAQEQKSKEASNRGTEAACVRCA